MFMLIFLDPDMKINEKSLASYATSRESIDKEGILNKKGEVNHGYKRRWFVLKGNMLFYYEKQGDKQPLGVIVLENCSVEVNDTDRFSFCVRYQSFNPGGTSRTYILCADNEVEMERWIKCITSASYNYTAMVVKEFEKILSRLESTDLDTTDNVLRDKPTLLSQSNNETDIADKQMIKDLEQTSKNISLISKMTLPIHPYTIFYFKKCQK